MSVPATILVVEDDEQMREVVARILRECGYRVMTAENGRRGLELARGHSGRLDLVITDIVMPEMGGGALAEQAKALHPEASVLYISAYPERAIPRYGVPLTTGNLLRKPFRLNSLVEMVRVLLSPAASRPTSAPPRSSE